MVATLVVGVERLRALADMPNLGRPQGGGDVEYFTLRRAGAELAAIYRRRRPESPDDIGPAASVERIVGAGPMSQHGSVGVDLLAVTPDGTRLTYSVRDRGQDEHSLRVLNPQTMGEVERCPDALWDSVSLKKDGSGFSSPPTCRTVPAASGFSTSRAPIEARWRGEMDLPPRVSASIRGDGGGKAELTVHSFTMPSTTDRVDLATGERGGSEA
ncbi:MAG: hypothetical protein OEW19_21280 [Acidobacteriota bacterium]|nr:hypothetical protein [Acidobacteriota bacterium]